MHDAPLWTIALSLFTFFAGLLLGHWLNIGRDRRKEFNDVADPIRAALIKDRENPSPFLGLPGIVELELFCSLLHLWQRGGFRSAVSRYKRAKNDALAQDEYGAPIYRDTEAIKRCVDDLLRYTTRR